MRVIEHNHICRQPPNNARRAVHFPPCLHRNAGLRPMTPILQHSLPFPPFLSSSLPAFLMKQVFSVFHDVKEPRRLRNREAIKITWCFLLVPITNLCSLSHQTSKSSADRQNHHVAAEVRACCPNTGARLCRSSGQAQQHDNSP